MSDGPRPRGRSLRAAFGRRRRFVFGCAATVAGLGAFGVLGFVAFTGWLGTEPGGRWLVGQLEARLQPLLAPGGGLRIGGVTSDWKDTVILEDVQVLDADGRPLVTVDRLAADVDLDRLLEKEVHLRVVRGDGILVDLVQDAEGGLDLLRVLGLDQPASGAPSEGLPVAIVAPDVALRGVHVRLRGPGGEVLRLAGVDLGGAFEARGTDFAATGLELSGHLAAPGPTVFTATGGVRSAPEGVGLEDVVLRLPDSTLAVSGTVGAALDLELGVRRLHLPSLDPLASGPGLRGTLGGDVTLRGPLDAIRVEGRLEGQDGTVGVVRVGGTVDAAASPVTYTATAEVETLHVDHLLGTVEQSVVLGGSAVITGAGLRWPDDLRVEVDWTGGPQEAYGQHLDTLRTHLVLERGRLTLSDTRLEGILGDLVASGELDLVGGPMNLVVGGRVTTERLAALGLVGVGTSGELKATVTGDLELLETEPVEVRGSIAWAPFRYGADVRFSRLRATFVARALGGAVDGEVDVVASGGAVYGLTIADTRLPQVGFEVQQGGAVEVTAGLGLAGVSLPGVFDVASADGTWDLALRGGARSLSASVQVGEHAWLGFPGTGGRLVVTLDGERVGFAVDLVDDTRQTLDVVGSFDAAEGHLVAERVALRPTRRAAWDASEPVALTLTDDGVREASVHLVGPLGKVSLEGTLGRSGPLDATVRVEDLALDGFAEMFPDQASDLYGTLDLELAVHGTGSAPEIEGRVHGEGLWVAGTLRWLDLDGGFTADRNAVRPDLVVGVAGEPLARVEGSVPVHLDLAAPALAPDGPLDAAVTLLPGALHRLERVSPSVQAMPEGRFGGVLEASGTLRDPALHLAGVLEVEVGPWEEPARLELDARREGREISGWADLRDGLRSTGNLGFTGVTRLGEVIAWALEGQGAGGPDHVRASDQRANLADAALWLDEMEVNGTLVSIGVDRLASLLGVDASRVGGRLSGSFGATGSPYTPRLDLGLQLLEGRIGSEPVESLSATVSPVPVGVRVDAALAFARGGGVGLEGVVPLKLDLRADRSTWSTAPMLLAITGEGVPLTVLDAIDPGIRDAEGTVVVSGRIGGLLSDPDPHLSLRLDGGALVYEPLGLQVSDLDVEVSADERQIVLSRFHAATDPIQPKLVGQLTGAAGDLERSEIGATARLGIAGGVLGQVEGDVKLDNGWVAANQDVKLRTHGSLSIDGEWPALKVRGDLAVRRGNIVLDTARFLDKAPLQPDPSLVIRRKGQRSSFVSEEGPAFYEDFDVAVDIELDRSVTLDLSMAWADDLGSLGTSVSRLDVSTRVDGSLDASLQDGHPALTGEVDLLEGGEVRVLASVLDLEESSIVFGGADITDPTLDIHASMELPNSSVSLAITGTQLSPEIRFTSAEYPEQSQVLTILLTGQEPDSQSLEDGGMASALANILADRLLSSAGLSAVSIEPDGAVKLRAPVSRRLYIDTRLDPTPTLGEPSLAVEGDWSLARGYVLTVGLAPESSGVDGQRGPLPSFGGNLTWWSDIFWQVRF